MSANFAAILYLAAGILFILALRGLSSPATSRDGNRYGMIGMALAVATTLLLHLPPMFGFVLILLGVAIGGGAGAFLAQRIEMTKMPELVAFFHSLVGLAAVLVASSAFFAPQAFGIGAPGEIEGGSLVEMSLGAAIGAITFTGSIIAFLKLSERMSGKPILLPERHTINIALGVALAVLINPEAGYFGVAPGTNARTNPNAMATIARDTLFTNVALRPDGTVWWEGHDDPPPAECLDWQGRPWTPASPEKAAHPNSRFTAPMTNNPRLAPEVNDPRGVPIDAIIFGGRRASTVPLVFQAFNWCHGVFLGATMGSEMTAAAVGGVGQVRRDPMAMLPFCGYNMGRYFRHWLDLRKSLRNPPRVFHVNWFRKDDQGRFLWPGFGENMRVLKWIIDRCRGRAAALEGALGWVPRWEDFDTTGLDLDRERFDRLQAMDPEEWRREILSHDELFMKLYRFLPKEMIFQRELLVSRL